MMAAPSILLTAAFLSMFPAMAADGDDQKPRKLFNGRDLSGWQGVPGWWRAEDGVLIAESTAENPCEKSNYLVWTGGQPSDFQLECEFRLSPEANSGIQIRSETRPGFDTYGYQADMTGDGTLIGFIYHHKHGLCAERGQEVTLTADGKREVKTFGTAAELLQHFKKDDWNQYRIICRGPEITLTLNGVLMCRITDLDPATAAKNGIIALQMHAGPPMKAEFKNILLTPLPPAKEARETKP
jgi:hypothetical protein